MNQVLPLLTIISLFVFSCKKEEAKAVEDPVTKQVEYQLFAAQDYSDPAFQHITVDLRLQIRKINYLTGASELLWDSVLTTRKIHEFPQHDSRVIIQKAFPILESHEKLNGGFSIKYNNNGMIQQQAGSDEAGPGTAGILLEVDL